jgi:hypothetical protein
MRDGRERREKKRINFVWIGSGWMMERGGVSECNVWCGERAG